MSVTQCFRAGICAGQLESVVCQTRVLGYRGFTGRHFPTHSAGTVYYSVKSAHQEFVFIKVLTPDSCGGCFIFNYNSSLRQEHIHNLSCKAGKTLDQINYLKYISSYRKKKTKETRAPNITSLLTILRARKRHREPLLKCHIYS